MGIIFFIHSDGVSGVSAAVVASSDPDDAQLNDCAMVITMMPNKVQVLTLYGSI